MKLLLTAVLFCCQAVDLIAAGKCPDSHPYAYYNGGYCCKAGIEKTFKDQGKYCDGSIIQLDSSCCLNDQYTPCPSGSCTNADKSLEECPKSHPYAYYGGQYCCASDTEKTYKDQGAKCDGSKIQFDSLCCLNDEYDKCPSGNCYTAGLIPGCAPYTEEACRAAGENLNLDVSEIAAGPGDIQGCFAYTNKDAARAGKVYFNLGATEEEMKSKLDSPNAFRPLGHDCKKPNIIFLMGDDMGYNDIGYNNPAVKTPNMDNLAEEGIKLEQNYVQASCTPSRIAFLSGMYPYHVGRQENVLLPNSPTGLSLNRSTIGDAMKSLGYDTHVIGKWHVGHCNDKYLPLKRGFDTFYGLTGPMADYVNKFCMGGYADWWDTENGEMKYVTKNENPTAFTTHSTIQYENRIKSLLSSRDGSRPFFMFLPMQHPHTPFQNHNTPEKYVKMYDESIFENNDRYKDHPNFDENSASGLNNHLGVIRHVSMLDDLVGNIIKSLEDNKLYENTVFVYSSDNGGMDKAMVGNFPYKGYKTTPYEGGFKVPGFVHSPLLPTSFSFTGMNHMSDWYPTFMRLGGKSKASVDSKGFDGVDQLETFFGGQGANPRTRFVYNIRKQFLWNTISPEKHLSGWIRDGDWKYGRLPVYEGIELHVLYDLSKDPTEQHNVAFENPTQLNTMKALFDELAESMVPADEPLAVLPKVYVHNGSPLENWCKEEDLYFDPCTSGPCIGDEE